MRPRAFDLELAHVRDVEDPGGGADRLVLGDHALVLHGHLPAGERHHARIQRAVPLVERGPAERLHDAGMLQSDLRLPGQAQSRRKAGTSSTSRGTSKPPCSPSSERVAGASSSIVARRRRRSAPGPNPVAITVTRTASFSASSITAPKITFAFLSAAPVTTSAASFTSKRPR